MKTIEEIVALMEADVVSPKTNTMFRVDGVREQFDAGLASGKPFQIFYGYALDDSKNLALRIERASFDAAGQPIPNATYADADS